MHKNVDVACLIKRLQITRIKNVWLAYAAQKNSLCLLLADIFLTFQRNGILSSLSYKFYEIYERFNIVDSHESHVSLVSPQPQ